MDPLYIPIVAILTPLVLVPTILALKYRHQRRQWEHLERLKAMEAQMPLPARQVLGGAGGVAAIGAGVPAVSVLGAFLTALLWEPSATGDPAIVPVIAWCYALLISIAAMLTSLKLASMQHRALKDLESAGSFADGKPIHDPDAFDVVSSRG